MAKKKNREVKEREKQKKEEERRFKIFFDEVKKWIEFFGIKDYFVTVSSSIFPEDENDAHGYCAFDPIARVADISLNIAGPEFDELTDRDIRQIAFHEVCELLLGNIVSLAHSREISYDQLEAEKHALIRRLENSIFKKEG